MEPEGTCTRCGAGVRIVVTLGGRRRELQTDPDPEGNHVLEWVDGVGGRYLRARVLTGLELPAQTTAWLMHRCPKPPKPGPRCWGCQGRMDAELAELEQWTHHPCCDPEYLRLVAHLNNIFRRRKEQAA